MPTYHSARGLKRSGEKGVLQNCLSGASENRWQVMLSTSTRVARTSWSKVMIEDVILVPIKRYSGAKGTSINKFSALRNPAEIQGGKRSGLGEWGLASSGSSKEISISLCQQGEVHTAVTFLGT
ncbi:predicted protein [Histoplasma capsulatum H143]|uniref:Uncharacterized protein n=1 Tax=Ajellomyces capsulatus (strain H143) TaxID=544712 RepID=C6HNP0_AJECH|nr:predicted protein [Histoplasma capsulatum H143]